MKVVIEFYRTRPEDSAHATVGSEMAEAADLEDAIQKAHALFQTLNMPQQPDALVITGADGTTLYSSFLEAEAGHEEEPRT